MSFLTPLYLLGALAVSLPILFHMIRRTPKGRTEFSSVMFLQPSPPKITRRSRIEHWLLLLLRALAVCLLALAFARPFLRQSEQQSLDQGRGGALVVLLDTSASMRRAGLWEEAVGQLDDVLSEAVQANHQVAVLGYDRAIRPIFSFQQWTSLDLGQRQEAVTAAVAETSPGWGATDLGSALIEAAEQLEALKTDEDGAQYREILVVSDVQAGSRLESLQSFDWPKGVPVRLVRVGEGAAPNNAGIQLVADALDTSDAASKQTRLRVINAAGADREEFQIRWIDEFDTQESSTDDAEADDTPGEAEVSVIVPAGQSRIVRAAPRPETPGVGRLVLQGDEHDFDNTCFVPQARPRSAVVAVLSSERTDDVQTMRFYLPAALPSLPLRVVHVVEWGDPATGDPETDRPHVVIVTGAIPSEQIEPLRSYVSDGGTVLVAAAAAEDLGSVYSLLDVAPVDAEEADVDDYAMLTNIDFSHPLFAALDDPRFSDFTKVRFWKHRVVSEGSFPDGKVLARFDTGSPALLESRLDEGRVIVLTSGWHPEDSQLATSTKFVPMLNGLVDDVAGIVERRTSYRVGESIPLAEFDLTADDLAAVRLPGGERSTLSAEATSFDETETPGDYEFLLNGSSPGGAAPLTFAVNLDPNESQTSPLSAASLASAGVRLTAEGAVSVADAAAQRQLRAGELEDRQKLWRWLVVAVIVILLVETLLASRAARRQLAT